MTSSDSQNVDTSFGPAQPSATDRLAIVEEQLSAALYQRDQAYDAGYAQGRDDATKSTNDDASARTALTHIVVTIYTPPAPKKTTGARVRRPSRGAGVIVNAYGPYNFNKAQYERKKMLDKAADEGYAQHLTVVTTQILNVTPQGVIKFSVPRARAGE